MRRRCQIVLFLFFSFACLPVNAQRHGVVLSAGECLPNNADAAYIHQFSGGVGYMLEWRQRDGCSLGWFTDVVAMHDPIAGVRFSTSLTIEDHVVGSLYEFIETGFSWYTNPYQRSLDEKNLFLGSYLNCHLGLGLRYRFQLDSVRSLSTAVRFLHSSNGYLRKPNMGLNYLTLELGYHVEPHRRVWGDPTPDTVGRKVTFFTSYAPSVVQQRGDDIHAPYCFAHSFLLGALHPFSAKRSLGGDVDLMYNYAHQVEARQNGDAEPFPLYVGVCGTYQRNWQRLFFRVSLGTDLIRSPYLLGPMYERIALNYRLTKDQRVTPYVGVACKAYYGHIDYIEWTLGFEW